MKIFLKWIYRKLTFPIRAVWIAFYCLAEIFIEDYQNFKKRELKKKD